MKKIISILLAVSLTAALAGCAAPAVEQPAPQPVATAEPTEAIVDPIEEPPAQETPAPLPQLPSPEADPESMFGVDKNINVSTIDSWLGREDVEYIDVRMLTDPGCYEAIGGDSMLSGSVQGFKTVPYPYLGTLSGLPPEVAVTQYEGPTLFDIEYDASGAISSIKANYAESEAIIQDLFPKDKPIFLMCGGGGYAGFTKSLLIELGYDPELIYNIGGFWEYGGECRLDVKTIAPDGTEYYAFHRLDYHLIDFDQLHPVS